MNNRHRYAYAIVIGLLALVLSLIFCLFVTDPKFGHKVDVSTMPVEARQIMDESPGTPITQEQWTRIRKILNEKSWTSGKNLSALDILASWYWLLVVPAIAIAILWKVWRAITPTEALFVTMPSILTLVLSYYSAI
jgi:hypothetical protein